MANQLMFSSLLGMAPNVSLLAKRLGFTTTTMRRKIMSGGVTMEELQGIADQGFSLELKIGPKKCSVVVSHART